jgi:hypothetical protein
MVTSSPGLPYIQKVDGQNPIALREMFPSVRIGGQQKGKDDDLALSD